MIINILQKIKPLNLEKKIEALIYLGKQIELKSEDLKGVQQFAKHKNSWFTQDNTNYALEQIATNFLAESEIKNWVNQYQIAEQSLPKNIGIIMAGSPPLAGFHDLLAVFLSGNKAKIKLSEDDKYLLPFLLKILKEAFPQTEQYFEIVERLNNFDAILASGNRESIKTFETYFSKIPNIIRKHKTSVGVLFGDESKEDLSQFGQDIFKYFGLSPRSVSKIFIPKDYNFVPLLEATHEFNEIVLHNKYKNNFDYNYTLHILNKVDYKANGCLMIIEDKALLSRIATIHYEVFDDQKHLEKILEEQGEGICQIVSNNTFTNFNNKSFGESNTWSLTDYENGIDTMNFLKTLA